MTSNTVYVVDTSSIIDLDPYPFDVFESLWKNIEGLARGKRLIAPTQVLGELSKRDDALLKWAKQNKQLFETPNGALLHKVSEVLAQFPTLIDPNSETEEADPFVVALALAQDAQMTLVPLKKVVVSEEKPKPGKTNIPAVCTHYKLECIPIIELFRRENWKF